MSHKGSRHRLYANCIITYHCMNKYNLQSRWPTSFLVEMNMSLMVVGDIQKRIYSCIRQPKSSELYLIPNRNVFVMNQLSSLFLSKEIYIILLNFNLLYFELLYSSVLHKLVSLEHVIIMLLTESFILRFHITWKTY